MNLTLQNPKEVEEEDYNINDENLGEPNKKKYPTQTQSHRRPKEDESESRQSESMSEEEDQEAFQINFQDNKKIAEDMKKTQAYKLHQELLSLIRDKIGLEDREKAGLFLRKMRELANEQRLLIDGFTMQQIESLLREKQLQDDQQILDNMDKVESMFNQKVAPSKYEVQKEPSYIPVNKNDTAKPRPMNIVEYEQEINNIMQAASEEEFEGEGRRETSLDVADEVDLLEDVGEPSSLQWKQIFKELDELTKQPAEEVSLAVEAQEELDEGGLTEIEQEIEDQAVAKLGENFEPDFAVLDRISKETSTFNQKWDTIETNKLIGEKVIHETEPSTYDTSVVDSYIKCENIDEKDLLKRREQLLTTEAQIMDTLVGEEYEEQYDISRALWVQNYNLRTQLIHNTKSTRDLLEQTLRQRDSLMKKLEAITKDHQSDAIPQKLYDFMGYDPKSKSPENYNAELLFHSRMFSINQDPKNPKYAELMEQVINQMKQNKVQPDAAIQARLGYLIAYLEKYNVDISNWPLQKFKSALDFYLNTSFNLSNVLVFTNYYGYYHQCRLNSELQNLNKNLKDLNEQQKYALNKYVFKDTESLVDMRALFSHLVDYVGAKETIDPITKSDAIWKIIDFFTRNGINDFSQKGETFNNTIDERAMALYFKNHMNGSKTFERVTSVILRTNESSSNVFQNHMLQYLKEYQSLNSSLPFSFDLLKVRNAYIKLKNASTKQNAKFSEKTLEYFLFLFKQLHMWPETIDLCENYNTLTQRKSDDVSEIKSYYLTEALLNIPSSQHYHKLVEEAVYQNKEPQTAGYITAMTKAYFKDGSINHAIKFFGESINNLKKLKQKREEVLVNLFDQIYKEENPRNLTYEQFKKKYLNLLLISNRLVKESFAVGQIRRVIQDKDYEEIDSLFQLYLVEKEENEVLTKLAGIPVDKCEDAKTMPVERISGLDEDERERLSLIRERKQALKSLVSEKDAEYMNNLLQIMKDQKLQVFKNLETKTADQITEVFNIINRDQIEEILDRTEPVMEAASEMIEEEEDEHTDNLDVFQKLTQSATNEYIEENIELAFDRENFPQKGFRKTLESYYDPKKQNELSDRSYLNDMDVLEFNEYLLDAPIGDHTDPANMAADVYDETVLEMKEELLKALTHRRSQVLNLTVNIFNKLQEQTLKTVRLDSVQEIQRQDLDESEINENLQKFNLLLNDQRSPIFSALQTMGRLKPESIPSFEETLNDLDFDPEKFDIETYRKENEHLLSLNDQLEESRQNLKAISYQLQKSLHEKEKTSGRGPQTIYEQAYAKWSGSRDSKLKDHLEDRIQALYNEYKQKLELNKEADKAEELPREDKLSLLRDIFTVEYQDGFTNNLFPTYYSQDLIIFGIENNIPEAVRLAEKMMSENNQTLSRDMQLAVKNYLLTNSEKYQEAVKNTGPIDNSTLYKKGTKQDSDEQPPIINYDDPYWADLYERTKRRTQNWRQPSLLAWDHKKYGIVGEVMDVKKMEQVHKRLQHARFI